VQRSEIKVRWAPTQKDPRPTIEGNDRSRDGRSESLIQSVIRAQWVRVLKNGTYGSVEELADANKLHPKVVRQNLRLAFLAPEVTSAILDGIQPAELALVRIPKLLALKWTDHQPLPG
jgi:hypothetical protein